MYVILEVIEEGEAYGTFLELCGVIANRANVLYGNTRRTRKVNTI